MHILEINKKKILLGLPVDEFEFDKINLSPSVAVNVFNLLF